MYKRITVQAEDDIIALEDGDYYYFPTKPGALSASVLRILADILDAKNGVNIHACEETQ
jgi:hypothetical protein